MTPEGGEPVSLSLDQIRAALPDGVGFYGGDFGTPDGFIETGGKAFSDRLKRHADATIKKGGYITKDDAYSDDRLRAVLLERGFDLEDDSLAVKAKLDPKQLQAVRERILAEEVNPLKDENASLAEAVERLRSQNVTTATKAEALSVFGPDVFKPPFEGGTSPFDQAMRRFVAFDEDGPYFQAREDDLPERDILKGLKAWADRQKKNGGPDWYPKESQSVPGPNGRPGGGGALSPEEIARLSQDPEWYAANRDKIVGKRR